MSPRPKVYICAATYREFSQVKRFLDSLRNVSRPDVELVLSNAAYPDETTAYLANTTLPNIAITEQRATPNDYWTAQMNLCLEYVSAHAIDNDYVISCNVDIEFDYDIVAALVAAIEATPSSHVGALGFSNRISISSGTIMNSWSLTLTSHPYAGIKYGSSLSHPPKNVSFLPGRCFIVRVKDLRAIGMFFSTKLPHYHSDVELSNRLRLIGCRPILNPNITFAADMANTGLSVYSRKQTLRVRLSSLFSLKNPSNPYYRWVMIQSMWPPYSRPSAHLLYTLRTLIEFLLLRYLYFLTSSIPGRGFSGLSKT